ncbi:MAG TPA: copper transporter [Acidimicrobiales bacterium]|nr:copper transporter [Acidimicrobiales bacterium]
MVNFRYHIISVVAVFLALGVGVVMGSAVIDRAVVGTLREQQAAIDRRIDEVLQEKGELEALLAEQQQVSEQLADEGSQRLLSGQLSGVPVVVVAVKDVDSTALDDVVQGLRTADADYEGTVQLTERLALTTEEQRRDLARALGAPEERAVSELRALAVDHLTSTLVPAAGAEEDSSPATGEVLAELRAAGFVDYEAPEGRPGGISELVMAGATVVLVSDAGAALSYEEWIRPLVEALTADRDRDGRPDVALLAVEALGTEEVAESEAEFTQALRADDTLSARLSTVNNVDRFAGRLAAVLAIQDLADGRVGHYGRGAQRLIPAPSR